MSIPAATGSSSLESDVAELATALRAITFPFATPEAPEAREGVLDALNQLDDYIQPRLERLDAPLLAVVGGSTGSGKSTLVNSIVGEKVTRASAIRPTTRRPILVHNGADAQWFEQSRILPGLARVRNSNEDGQSYSELALAVSERIPRGLAILDSPDIDSVVEENRRLAAQLMAAADLWIFVTTAARYADAIPWAMLDQAASRDIVVAVVLNRVPVGVGVEVRADLARRMEERGLSRAPLFVVAEKLDDDGSVADEDVAPLQGWLEGLARDAATRSSVARQTLSGALEALVSDLEPVARELDEQSGVAGALGEDLERGRASARTAMRELVDDGRIMRGEVLARWNQLVSTGSVMRAIEGKVSSLRDRLTSWVRGGKDSTLVVGGVEEVLTSAFIAEVERASQSVGDAWGARSGCEAIARSAAQSLQSDAQREAAAREAIAQWRRELAGLVEAQGKEKKASARMVSVGVNVVGAALMVVVFASTAGLTGAEAAIAGGTAVVAERLLEGIFGDDAVRKMAASAREDLMRRFDECVEAELTPYARAYEAISVFPAEELRRMCARVRATKRGEMR